MRWALWLLLSVAAAALGSRPHRQAVRVGVSQLHLVSLTPRSSDPPPRLSVFVVAGLHPREAGARAVCRDWIERAEAAWSGRIAWRFVCDANPLGSASPDAACRRHNPRGVDLNRNWPAPPFAESRRNASAAEEYGGPEPLSEDETRSLLEALRGAGLIDLLLDLHWGDRALLAPYDCCPRAPVRNMADHVRLGRWLVSNETVPGRRVGRGSTHMYRAVGTLTDHAYLALGVPLSLTIEMDSGRTLPERPSCEELFGFREREALGRWASVPLRLEGASERDFTALSRMSLRTQR